MSSRLSPSLYVAHSCAHGRVGPQCSHGTSFPRVGAAHLAALVEQHEPQQVGSNHHLATGHVHAPRNRPAAHDPTLLEPVKNISPHDRGREALALDGVYSTQLHPSGR